jgi:hypothetical protein
MKTQDSEKEETATEETAVVIQQKTIDAEVSKFEHFKNEIKKATKEAKGLTIAGIEDKEGYKVVHDKRMILKNIRVKIEKTRKDLKAGVLAMGKAIDDKAKELTALLEPAEKTLHEKEKAIDDEIERLKQEEERKKREKIQARYKAIAALGMIPDPYLNEITDEEFERYRARVEECRKYNKTALHEEVVSMDDATWSNHISAIADAYEMDLAAEAARKQQEEEEKKQAAEDKKKRAELEEENRLMKQKLEELERKNAPPPVTSEQPAERIQPVNLSKNREKSEAEEDSKRLAEWANQIRAVILMQPVCSGTDASAMVKDIATRLDLHAKRIEEFSK